jgi:3-oxoacyl-[acyl-carrier-protein] synthase II
MTATLASTLAVTGLGVLSGQPSDVSGMFDEDLPSDTAHALTDFTIKAHLGRKGTSFFDRGIGLGLVACTAAIENAGLAVTDESRPRTGIVLGTTHGSTKSTSDFSRDTFTEHRPYHVNPLVFPNAVMNSVAGQAAIWTTLRGPNSTVAGGVPAMAQVLRYGRNLLGCGYADVLLAGCVEELSPQHAWAVRAAQEAEGGDLPAGEGAAVFVVERAAAVAERGATPVAEILAAEVASVDPPRVDPGRYTDAFATCVRRAVARSGALPTEIRTVYTGANGMTAIDDAETRAIDEVLGTTAERIAVAETVGEAGAAFGGLQLAAAVGGPPGLSVLTSRSIDGAIGVLVVRAGDVS